MRAVAVVAAAAVAIAGVSVSSGVDGATTTRARTPTRYSLVHGCYALSLRGHAIAPKVGPFRMQPAALAVYLLYGRHNQYLADLGGGKIAGASAPRAATEWRVGGTARRGFKITNLSTRKRL